MKSGRKLFAALVAARGAVRPGERRSAAVTATRHRRRRTPRRSPRGRRSAIRNMDVKASVHVDTGDAGVVEVAGDRPERRRRDDGQPVLETALPNDDRPT